MPYKKQEKTKKTAVSAETSESIALQTAEFLQAGGKVEFVKRGVSGQEHTGAKKQISYAKK